LRELGFGVHNRIVQVAQQTPIALARPARPVSTLAIFECDRDIVGVLLPRPEIQIVARFGPLAREGLDVHAFGVRQRVHRKVIHGGQRTVSARLRLGVCEAVLGVPAAAMAGRVVMLEELWGDVATARLRDRLADARDMASAAATLAAGIAERRRASAPRDAHAMVLAAAEQLATTSVNAVANVLGVSERHLRRVFREAVGVGPKAFAKLLRFRRAVRAAREDAHPSWASIAASAGYYDQAHLISEFRVITGVTPRAFLLEIRGAVV
jgi:AraC-like DNA-binding protein